MEPITDAEAAENVASAHLARMLRAEPQRLRRRSISLGVPAFEADDAAQNAALRAWRLLGTLRSVDEGPMCAWLDTIVRSTAIDMHRASGPAPWHSDLETPMRLTTFASVRSPTWRRT